jgi:hypothetical protein
LSADLLCILIVTDHVSTHGQSQRRRRIELEYIRLVEDYWENGRSKRRVIANFGRKDSLRRILSVSLSLAALGTATMKRFTINN